VSVPEPWVVDKPPPEWVRVIAEKERWPDWAIATWRDRLKMNEIGRVGITYYTDHATIDLDSHTFENLDPNGARPLDDALLRAVSRIEKDKREEEQTKV
jgi:hypothetical protein